MDAELISKAINSDAEFLLQQMGKPERDDEVEAVRATYEMQSQQGEVIGYVRCWRHRNGFQGFVQFDADGSVVDWRMFGDGLPVSRKR